MLTLLKDQAPAQLRPPKETVQSWSDWALIWFVRLRLLYDYHVSGFLKTITRELYHLSQPAALKSFFLLNWSPGNVSYCTVIQAFHFHSCLVRISRRDISNPTNQYAIFFLQIWGAFCLLIFPWQSSNPNRILKEHEKWSSLVEPLQPVSSQWVDSH